MKRLLMAMALTCLFSVSTLAGDVPTSDYMPPPPPPPGTNRPAGSASNVTIIQAGIPESESASLDILESVMVTIVGLLAR